MQGATLQSTVNFMPWHRSQSVRWNLPLSLVKLTFHPRAQSKPRCVLQVRKATHCLQAIQDVEATIGLEGYRARDGGVCAFFKARIAATELKIGLNMRDCLQVLLLRPQLCRRMTTDSQGQPVSMHLS